MNFFKKIIIILLLIFIFYLLLKIVNKEKQHFTSFQQSIMNVEIKNEINNKKKDLCIDKNIDEDSLSCYINLLDFYKDQFINDINATRHVYVPISIDRMEIDSLNNITIDSLAI